jgi:hypothetical protein
MRPLAYNLPAFLDVYGTDPPPVDTLLSALSSCLYAPFELVRAFYDEFPSQENRSRLLCACALRYLAVASHKHNQAPMHSAEAVIIIASIVRPRNRHVQRSKFVPQDLHWGEPDVTAKDPAWSRWYWRGRLGINPFNSAAETRVFTFLYQWANVIDDVDTLHQCLGQPCGRLDPRMALFDGPIIAATLWSCMNHIVPVALIASKLQHHELPDDVTAKRLYEIVAHPQPDEDDILPAWSDIGRVGSDTAYTDRGASAKHGALRGNPFDGLSVL